MEIGFGRVAALIGEPARATMLLALLDGRALPAGELAFGANVAPQTASGHLAKLVEGGLISVENQGRHRYYRLAGPDVGTALEALGELAPAPRVRDRESQEVKILRYARTCYNHLAGRLAVDIHAAMQRHGLLTPVNQKQCELTELGHKWFAEIAREDSPKFGGRQTVARLCLDWTERQHHLGGPLGCTLLTRLCERKWIVRMRGRAVRLTLNGRVELGKQLGLVL
ncbi:MAG TPA: helix-turn-helix transcriptional regulator [Bryobacteraceae bacterium]|nr:helix-turn-helix transcriptional regulator [Bryobacteraceae bacterium]